MASLDQRAGVAFRRVRTPESTTDPGREIALKYQSYVAKDLGGHEDEIGIEPARRQTRTAVDGALSQLTAGADYEIRDVLLRLTRS